MKLKAFVLICSLALLACEKLDVPTMVDGKGYITFIFEGEALFAASVDKCFFLSMVNPNEAKRLKCGRNYKSYDTLIMSDYYTDTCEFFWVVDNCWHHFSFNDFDTSIYYSRAQNHKPVFYIDLYK